MPRADFYLTDSPRFRDQPLLLVCELARKCLLQGGQPTLLLCASQQQAEALDELLWAFDEDAYIPHQIAGTDEEDAVTPVLLVAPGTEVPPRPLVINLRDAAVTLPCERVLEVVPADPAQREALRERWRQYKARGFHLTKHDM